MAIAAMMDQQEFRGEFSDAEHTHTEYALEGSKGEAPSIWRSLMHIKLLLPYVGKLLPALEGNFSALAATAAPVKVDLTEIHTAVATVKRGFLDLEAGNRTIRTQVREQSAQLRRMDDQLLRLRDSTERNAMEHQELVEDLRSASKLIRGLSTIMIILLVIVTAMVAFMLLHWRH